MRRIHVLHLLASGAVEFAAISQVVRESARLNDPTRYRYSAWFLHSDGPLRAGLEEVGVTVALHPWDGRTDPAGGMRIVAAIRRGGFDIVHCHSGGRSLLWLLRGGTSARIVAHVHALATESGRPGPIRVKTGGAHAVIANSIASSHGIRSRRMHVVYPGVRTDLFRPEPTPPAGPPIVGAVSRLAPVKGLPDLIAACARLRAAEVPFTLEIAGEGHERTALEGEARRAGVGDEVRLLGWREDIALLHRRWTLFVQPSHAEGFGLAALEAMASGLPVVASRVGGLEELVAEGVTGRLVPSGDPTALAEAMRAILSDPARARSMGAAGRERAEELFTAERMVEGILGVYAGLGQRQVD